MAGPDDAPFDVDPLSGRTTRRGGARGTVRVMSVVGAAALVALLAVVVADRTSRTSADTARTVLVACGSPVADLPLEASSPIGVTLGVATNFDNEPAPPPPRGTSLGRVDAGGAASLQVVTTLTDAELAAMPQAAVDRAHQMLVRWRTTLTVEKARRPVDRAVVRRIEESIAWWEPTISHLDDVRDRARTGTSRAEGQILLVEHGLVVATEPVPALTADALLNPDRTATTQVPLELQGCADGSGALPAGEYEVYVTDPGAVGPAAAGPWTITVR